MQSSSSNVNVKVSLLLLSWYGLIPSQRDPATTRCTTTTIPSPKSIPLGTPTCLTGFSMTQVSSACSCLSIPTPTKVTVTTTTLSTSTVTTVSASTAHSTVYTTTTVTTFTSTYSGTQYYTSTFTILPPPSSTIKPSANPTETFGAYASLDYAGQDIQNFFCYTGGPAAPTPFVGTSCTNFVDCVNECAYYNANNLGSSSNTTCGAVVYNSPDNGASSGSCYLKTSVQGCGGKFLCRASNDRLTAVRTQLIHQHWCPSASDCVRSTMIEARAPKRMSSYISVH